MFEILRATARIAHQGRRTLPATAALLSTRQTENKTLIEREKALTWGITHGIARPIKSL
jgi:hypothetical protein